MTLTAACNFHQVGQQQTSVTPTDQTQCTRKTKLRNRHSCSHSVFKKFKCELYWYLLVSQSVPLSHLFVQLESPLVHTTEGSDWFTDSHIVVLV